MSASNLRRPLRSPRGPGRSPTCRGAGSAVEVVVLVGRGNPRVEGHAIARGLARLIDQGRAVSGWRPARGVPPASTTSRHSGSRCSPLRQSESFIRSACTLSRTDRRRETRSRSQPLWRPFHAQDVAWWKGRGMATMRSSSLSRRRSCRTRKLHSCRGADRSAAAYARANLPRRRDPTGLARGGVESEGGTGMQHRRASWPC